jgi:aconitase A
MLSRFLGVRAVVDSKSFLNRYVDNLVMWIIPSLEMKALHHRPSAFFGR